MKHIILYAHPNPKSFCHAILEKVEANIKKAGGDSVTRDIYALKFDPVLTGDDFAAFAKGAPKADIKKEQELIASADHIIIIHPIWWFSMPAMLKGYVDRVFSKGFAYDYTKDGLKGLLAGKKATMINTTGGDKATYENYGFKDALKKTMEAGTYGLCGLEVVSHVYFHAVPTSSPGERAKWLEEAERMVF